LLLSHLANRRWRAAAVDLAAAVPQAAATGSEQELLTAVKALGYPASIFPGDEAARSQIDSSVQHLEAANPTPAPLQQPGRGGQPSPLLLGDWKLVYASSGTYVTRTSGAQALLAASKLPGTGVADVQQSLRLEPSSSSSGSGSSSSSSSSSDGGGRAGQQLLTANAARFGLGPMGEWEVCINGVWDVQDGSLAKVSFTNFTLQLVGMLGFNLPRMAKVRLLSLSQ
jgi:hypothetical protein